MASSERVERHDDSAVAKALAETVPSPKQDQPERSDGDTLVMPDAAGDATTNLVTVDPDHYEQHEELARGGMGLVRRAHDRRIGREVALKELLDDAPHLRRRFEREARVTGQLQHPGIVPVYEVGRWPDGSPFYTMKLLEGRPLDAVINEALDEGARLALVTRLLPAIEAIAYAHDRGVIHRDLKPANILLGAFGETVVIDWGLAKAIGEDDDESPPVEADPTQESLSSSSSLEAARSGGKLTLDGAVMGTPAYMPPEQACGEPVDARADVYSLGALLYHTLTGRPPYDQANVHAILAAVLKGPPPPVARVAPRLPPDLVAIVDKAMAPDPLDRYANAGELARDLQAFSTGRLVGGYHYSSGELLARFVRRNPALSATLLGLAVIVIVGSAVIFRAYRISEAERVRAEQAETRARQEERAVHERLAQMHVNRAIERLREHDHLAAELFAAAALVEQPANEASPHHDLSDEVVSAAGRRAVVAAPGATWAAARALRFAERGRELPMHDDWVYDVLPSADGRWVVTTGADRLANIWDTRTGTLHATLVGHEDTVYQVAWSQDERQLATSSYDGTLRLWSFPEGSLDRVIEHPSDRVYGICYAPDGRLIASGAGGVVAFYDPASGELLSRMDVAAEIPLRLSCSRQRPLALLGTRGSGALLLDVEVGEVRHQLEHDGNTVRVGLIAPDGRHAVTADRNGRLRRFDVATGELLQEVVTDGAYDSIAMSADGRWLALGDDTITVMDGVSLRPVARLRDHRARVFALAFDGAGRRLYSGGFDRRVVEWVLPAEPRARRFLSATESRIDGVELSADGATVVASGDDGTVTWWDRRSGVLLQRVDVHTGPSRALASLNDGRLVSAGLDRTLQVIDQRTRKVTKTVALPHFGDALSLHPDGRTLALGSGDGTVVLYDTATWTPRVTDELHRGRTWWVGYDPRGERLASASFAGTVAILDAASDEVVVQWKATDSRIYDAAWRPDGRELVTVDYDGWVRTWDPSTGAKVGAWRVLDGERLERVAYSSDATQLALTSHRGLRLYTPEGGLIARLDLDSATSVGFADDGRIVLAIDGEVILLPIEPETWRTDPRRLVAEAEKAAAASLGDMMGMATPVP